MNSAIWRRVASSSAKPTCTHSSHGAGTTDFPAHGHSGDFRRPTRPRLRGAANRVSPDLRDLGRRPAHTPRLEWPSWRDPIPTRLVRSGRVQFTQRPRKWCVEHGVHASGGLALEAHQDMGVDIARGRTAAVAPGFSCTSPLTRGLPEPTRRPDILTRGRPKRSGTYPATLTCGEPRRTRSLRDGHAPGNQALDVSGNRLARARGIRRLSRPVSRPRGGPAP
jgi:hypothetical protein